MGRPRRPRLGAPRKVLTDEDKEYIRLLNTGMKKNAAFRKAYPQNKTVRRYEDSIGEERHRAAVSLNKVAYDKLDAKYMQEAMTDYQQRMKVFSDKAVETAIHLVENARSEKVRADLAIEGMRHEVGTPVQKVQVQQEKQVYLQFGTPSERDKLDDIPSDFIEGEVVS